MYSRRTNKEATTLAQYPVLQSSLGRVKTVYKEGSNISTLLLAKIIKVNYQYNTVDVQTVGNYVSDVFTNTDDTSGKYSAKLPVEFGGMNYLGKYYGQINPIEVGNLVLVGFINGSKSGPIVIGIYEESTVSNALAQVELVSADANNTEVKPLTNQRYTVFPSLTYERIDGNGNRTVSFTGKSFLIMSDIDSRSSGITDANNGTVYEDIDASYYNTGELIEPISAQAPTVLFKHQGIETEEGEEDKHLTMLYLGKDGTFRLSQTDKDSTWRTYFVSSQDKTIGLVQQRNTNAVDNEEDSSYIKILEDGTISLKNGSNLWELREDGIFNGGSPQVATELDAAIKNVNDALSYFSRAQTVKLDQSEVQQILNTYLVKSPTNPPSLNLNQRQQLQGYYSTILKEQPALVTASKNANIAYTALASTYTALKTYMDSTVFFSATGNLAVTYDQLYPLFSNYYNEKYKVLLALANAQEINLTAYEQGIYSASTQSLVSDTEIKLQATNIEILGDTVASNTAAITVNATQIQSKVSRDEVSDMIVESASTIGRNLFNANNVNTLGLSNSASVFIQGANNIGWYTEVTAGDAYSMKRWSTPNNRFSYVFSTVEPVEGGTFFGGNYGQAGADGTVYENIIVPTGATYLFLYLSTQKDSLPNIKVEKGTSSTNWTAAPEQIDEDIKVLTHTTAENTIGIGTISNSVSSLTTRADNTDVVLNEQSAAINLNTEGINLSVKKNAVISEINQSAEAIQIQASKINLIGQVTFESLDTSTQGSISGSQNKLASWSSTSDTTFIDGGKIYADSITANQIDVENLTANAAFLQSLFVQDFVGVNIEGTTITNPFTNILSNDAYLDGVTTLDNASVKLHVTAVKGTPTGTPSGQTVTTELSPLSISTTIWASNSSIQSSAELSGGQLTLNDGTNVGSLSAAQLTSVPWIILAPAAGFQISEGNTMMYRKVAALDGAYYVELMGQVAKVSGTFGTAQSVVSKLPEGYRPGRTQMFQQPDNTFIGSRLAITTGGNLQINTTSSATYVSLSGIRFLQEA